MNASDVLFEVRKVGAELAVVGDRLRCEAPTGALTPELRAAIAECKPGLIDLLSDERAAVGPPLDPAVALARRLYPALNQTVATPRGPGRLWQVFSSRVGVVLDVDPARVAFFHPDRVKLLDKRRDPQ